MRYLITENQFKSLYLRYAPELIFFARKFVDNLTAEDIVHDIFLKIWNEKITDFSHPGLKTFLMRMVRNACYDCLKHKTIEETFLNKMFGELEMEELEWYNSHEDDFLGDDKIKAAIAEINKLSFRCKEIFVKAYVDGQKHTDIASQLNISIRTVESQIYKALKIIRDNLGMTTK